MGEGRSKTAFGRNDQFDEEKAINTKYTESVKKAQHKSQAK